MTTADITRQQTTGTGGTWLLERTAPPEIFTRERLTDEHQLISQTALDFVRQEVLPKLDDLCAKDWSVARALLRRCGELGLLGVDTPEEYGGVALDKVSSVLVAEAAALDASFATTFGAMTGLAIVPLLCFGTEAQRRRYLPGLVTGETVGAYALSESGSGSDALGARTRAVRAEDGSFVLDGEKMWITNGGFADVFIVFAKVDGEQFTAFIVERGFPGVSTGKEEHKMGLHGSSTAPLLLQGARVPADNLLGEVGKGHKVAFNVLNYGRFKLGAMCTGGARQALADAARYAAQRRQFNRPIAEFGAIRYKLGEMAARLYAVESLLYRLAGDIDEAAGDGGPAAMLQALEGYAVEASIAKVASSETLQYVLDENVQIHGGNGYVRDYPAERYYRDARVNRIFEGTNEINRLLIPGMLMKRAVKGDLPLIAAAKKLQQDLLTPAPTPPPDDPIAQAAAMVEGMRKLTLMALGSAMQRFGEQVQEEQEVLSWVADLAIDTYASDSAVLRARQARLDGCPHAEEHVQAVTLAVHGAAARAEQSARQALAATLDGDMLRTALAGARRFLKPSTVNLVPVRRALADAVVGQGGYLW
jgi:alkylation response protein AidB-like acyl-CoA dehydrogenase